MSGLTGAPIKSLIHVEAAAFIVLYARRYGETCRQEAEKNCELQSQTNAPFPNHIFFLNFKARKPVILGFNCQI